MRAKTANYMLEALKHSLKAMQSQEKLLDGMRCEAIAAAKNNVAVCLTADLMQVRRIIKHAESAIFKVREEKQKLSRKGNLDYPF